MGEDLNNLINFYSQKGEKVTIFLTDKSILKGEINGGGIDYLRFHSDDGEISIIPYNAIVKIVR